MAQTKQRRRSGAGSGPKAALPVLSGGALSVALGAAVLLLLTAALCAGRLEEPMVLKLFPAVVGLGTFVGGLWAARGLGERFLPTALGAAALGAALWLMVGALALDGVTPAGGVRVLLSALAGGALAGLVCPG